MNILKKLLLVFCSISILLVTACGGGGGGSDSGSTPNQTPDAQPLTNEPPVLNDEIFSQPYVGVLTKTLNVTDKEGTESLKLSLIESANNGVVEFDGLNFTYRVIDPTQSMNFDTFRYQVIDGDNVVSATVTIDFTAPLTPLVITLLPFNNSLQVLKEASVELFSSRPLDLDTVSFNATTGTCIGTVQLSADDFTTCLALINFTSNDFNTAFSITPESLFSPDTQYKMKLTTGIRDQWFISYAGLSSSFKTHSSQLLITEIHHGKYSLSHWLEIYNPTPNLINLGDYILRSNVHDLGSNTIHFDHRFELDNKQVPPNSYFIIRAKKTGVLSPERELYVADGDLVPYWSTNGFVELIHKGSNVVHDFVRFGNENISSGSPQQWSGANAAPSGITEDSTLARNVLLVDTNTRMDWQEWEFSSPGGANDITCNDDLDADGIPDCSEAPGSTYAGLPLYEWGARINQPDIFIEIDYMDATNNGAQSIDIGLIPQKEALQKVKDVFAEHNIHVHFDVGDLIDTAAGINPENFDLGGGQQVPYAIGIALGEVDGLANFYDFKRNYMQAARLQIFHYLLFANSQNASGTGSFGGRAELNGNDVLITLGEGTHSKGTLEETNFFYNTQAVTLMHELGHNLGLQHGGHEDVNYKPNYLSIMNYLYSTGLSTVGDQEGDRYYSSAFNLNTTCKIPETNPLTSTTFILNYSDGSSLALDENNITESAGLRRLGSSGIDFNCDGDTSDTELVMDLNTSDIPSEGGQILTDSNDWDRLNLIFTSTYNGFESSIKNGGARQRNDIKLIVDRIGDDRQIIADEYESLISEYLRAGN